MALFSEFIHIGQKNLCSTTTQLDWKTTFQTKSTHTQLRFKCTVLMLTLALNYYVAYSAKKQLPLKLNCITAGYRKKYFDIIFFKVCDFEYVSLKKCILTFLCCFESLDRRRTRPVSKRSLWMSRSDLP